MANVSKWLKLARSPPPSKRLCQHGKYKGWQWQVIVKGDPEWILWLLTESRVLLNPEEEKYLLSEIKNLTWE